MSDDEQRAPVRAALDKSRALVAPELWRIYCVEEMWGEYVRALKSGAEAAINEALDRLNEAGQRALAADPKKELD